MLQHVNHVGPQRTIVQQLSEKGVSPEQVDTVLFSHAHWDHSRPISDVFPNAMAYFGPGTKSACSPGHLEDRNAQWDGRFFDPNHATERWEELAGTWVNFGPFNAALNYFGDGSFWIIQSPGHMPGNLSAAARLRDGHWVLLGSDCCHSRELLDGKQEIAQFNGTMSLHSDLHAAKETIAKIRNLERERDFHVALAHDASWLKKGTDSVLMSLLDDYMEAAVKEGRLARDEIP
ncbi:Nn.00g053130.m01.CDS01 [Neocucurbitaria sp. VM-36]